VLRDQVLCQKRLGKAAAKSVAKRNKLVQTKCIAQLQDSEDCRADQSRDARPKLDQIDKMLSAGTG
jgi:hypothetical protein